MASVDHAVECVFFECGYRRVKLIVSVGDCVGSNSDSGDDRDEYVFRQCAISL